MSQTQATKWQFAVCLFDVSGYEVLIPEQLESECISSDLMRNFVLFSGATVWFSENWMRI